MMKRLNDYLVDRYFDFATLQMTFRVEQPRTDCICDEGRVYEPWLYQRAMCTCSAKDEPDPSLAFHPLDCAACKSVPCPLCAPEVTGDE